MKNIIFITKDALNKGALPIYGNKYWKTPNIDELAKKGTVFNRHYTAGGSTAMAFTSMSIGRYCYETDRSDYKNEKTIAGDTLFDKLYDRGYECHIMWDSTYTDFAESHFRCEGRNSIIHSLKGIKQIETRHIKGEFDSMVFDNKETNYALNLIRESFEKIKTNARKNIFIWLHLPHVLRGRQGYGSDIDVFDHIVGIARELFEDDEIFVSADHGHMNGCKGQYHYGFDVDEEVVCIPLITPLINGQSRVDFPTSSIQMYEILYNQNMSKMDYVICETAYYAQPKRKIAIIYDKYKYVYSKEDKKEYLYDLEYDPQENHNLVYPEYYDKDRFLWYSTAQCFYYPYWKDSHLALNKLRTIKNNMWKTGNCINELYNALLHRVKCIYTRFKLAHPDDNIKNIGK